VIILVAITLVNKNAENETLQHFACDQFKGICVFESFVTNEFSNSAAAAGSWSGGGLGNITECAEFLGLEVASPLSTDVAAFGDDLKDGSSRAGGKSGSNW